MDIRNKGIAIALLVFVGCGYEVRQEKPFEVKPVDVEVHHTFDFEAVEGYYYEKCLDDLKCSEVVSTCKDSATTCAKVKTAEFLDTLAALTQEAK